MTASPAARSVVTGEHLAEASALALTRSTKIAARQPRAQNPFRSGFGIRSALCAQRHHCVMRNLGRTAHVEGVHGPRVLAKHQALEDSRVTGQCFRTFSAKPWHGRYPPQRAHRAALLGDGGAVMDEEAGRNVAAARDYAITTGRGSPI